MCLCLLAMASLEAGGGSPEDGLVRVDFLGRSLNFSLDYRFSAASLATKFLTEISDANASLSFEGQMIAVRDLIENAAVDFLGPARIEAAFDKKDIIAYSVIEAICRDFPQNHGMSYARFFPRQTPVRIIDGMALSQLTHS